MAEYTSTREGFQRYMKTSLIGPAEDAKAFVEATTTPTFQMTMNGVRTEYDAYISTLAGMRGQITEYNPVVQEFLRDGNQLAARVTGVLKLNGVETSSEIFMFAKVNKESGKLESLIERAVWGAVGKEPEHGVN